MTMSRSNLMTTEQEVAESKTIMPIIDLYIYMTEKISHEKHSMRSQIVVKDGFNRKSETNP